VGLAGSQRADSAQIFEDPRPGGRTTPRRGGGLHQVVSELNFCLQIVGRGEDEGDNPMTRLEYYGRKQRNEENPRQVVGCRNIFNMNLLIPRRRSQPQLNCLDYYKYRAPVLIILISAVVE
jgi:hypothetical protein